MRDPAVPATLSPTPADLWSVDERSLDLFAKQLDAPPAPRAWYELRREAEHVALVPGFDRLITLGGHAIKELPHQIDVAQRDRKSTRLNSSHQIISYAVFCLKKKKKNKQQPL